MEKLENFGVKIEDKVWLTFKQASIMCDMTMNNFRQQVGKFTTIKFADVWFVDMNEIVEYNNHRLYMKALKERSNNDK